MTAASDTKDSVRAWARFGFTPAPAETFANFEARVAESMRRR